MSRREAHRRARLEAIEQGALRIVRDGGLDALTMPTLAKEVGGAVGALYRYFASKEELLLALQLRALEAFDRLLARELDSTEGEPPLVRLRGALHSWGRFITEEPELHELLQLSIAHPRALLDDTRAAQVAERFAPMVQRCGALLAEAEAQGALVPGDREARVWVLWGAVTGLEQLRKQDHRRADEHRAESLVDMAIDGLLSGWSASRSQPLDP